jgi:hypothetical protein
MDLIQLTKTSFLSSSRYVHLRFRSRRCFSPFQQDDLDLNLFHFRHPPSVEEDVNEDETPFEDGIVAIGALNLVDLVLDEEIDEGDEEGVEGDGGVFPAIVID